LFGCSRDVLYYEQLLKILTNQYEAAEADEVRSAVIIQVLDPAELPERKSKPHRALIVLLAGMLGLGGSFLLTFILVACERLCQDPARAEQLYLLRQSIMGAFDCLTGQKHD